MWSRCRHLFGDGALAASLFGNTRLTVLPFVIEQDLCAGGAQPPCQGPKIWPHAGSIGINSTGHCQEKDNFQRLIERLREIAFDATGFTSMVATALLR